MSTPDFDPRTTAARPDLAAEHLKGKVKAARFVGGVKKRVAGPKTPVHRSPSYDAVLDTEALHGERVAVYETTKDGWCWGQLDLDGYVGWMPVSALADDGPPPTHRVSALRTFVFPAPDIKRRFLHAYSFGSRVSVSLLKDEFAVTDAGGFIYARHLAPIDEREEDFVATAQRFLGTPYLWGGRSSIGLDCSGLVQVALQAAGFDCPRDSDMQAAIGDPVQFTGDLRGLRRGDLVCWRGHIGILTGPDRLLHANAFHMAVAEEPLAEAVARIRESGSEITTVRRVGSG